MACFGIMGLTSLDFMVFVICYVNEEREYLIKWNKWTGKESIGIGIMINRNRCTEWNNKYKCITALKAIELDVLCIIY